MASTSSMNRNNSAVKRIMQEARELANDPSTDYTAAPLEDDIFEWHCTIRGPEGTEFEGGLYHVRILLPAEYPFRPPSLMVLTPNGRFELNTKICISFTNYHEELWQPAWGVRTAILGLQGFFPLKGQAAVGVGSIEFPASERKRLAELSRSWTCPHCQQTNLELLPDPVSTSSLNMPPSTEMQGTTDSVEVDSERSASPVPATQPVHVLDRRVDHSPLSQPTSALSDTHNNTAPSHTQDSLENRTLPLDPISFSRRQDQVYSSSSRPPFLLDTAICVLLVLVFALICRRML
ncbi:UBC-like protein [Marasmius fiardii PR-910]|nr:UBC-like protein [Marasmius fiardii PR-910]